MPLVRAGTRYYGTVEYRVQDPSPPSVPLDDPRARLVLGFVRAIEETGYAAATIADIVRHARVSKRTFYEHFSDKEGCFLAAYLAASEQTLLAIAEAATKPASWEKQLDAALDAYLGALESNPALTRTCLLEILSAGPGAILVRREVQQRFAEQLRGFADAARRRHPELKRLTPAMAAAIVGGINELVLLSVERGPARRLSELAATAGELVRAVVGGDALLVKRPRRGAPS